MRRADGYTVTRDELSAMDAQDIPLRFVWTLYKVSDGKVYALAGVHLDHGYRFLTTAERWTHGSETIEIHDTEEDSLCEPSC